MTAAPRGAINHELPGSVRQADGRYDRDSKRARTAEGHDNSSFGGPMPYDARPATTGGPGVAMGGPGCFKAPTGIGVMAAYCTSRTPSGTPLLDTCYHLGSGVGREGVGAEGT